MHCGCALRVPIFRNTLHIGRCLLHTAPYRYVALGTLNILPPYVFTAAPFLCLRFLQLFPCGHYYCGTCATTALAAKRECPMCRQHVRLDQVRGVCARVRLSTRVLGCRKAGF